MVRHVRIIRVIVCCVIVPMRVTKWTHLWQLFLLDFVVFCVGNLLELPLCVIGVLGVVKWDVLHHP
jgi:hypothetical protein